jgi:hypothetical protein
MADNDLMLRMSEQYQIEQIIKANEFSKEYGLTLTKEEATVLAQCGRSTLKTERRVEFGDSIMPKLIRAFADSSFINKDNYADILVRLQDIFYLYKNESMDMVSDDDLISIMKNAYERESGGDLQYLEGTALEVFARKVRAGENWTDRYKREKLHIENDYNEL